MSDQVKSKDGQVIKIGDEVETKIRGGVHKGEVSACSYSVVKCLLLQVDSIVTTQGEADEAGVKNPPTVC